MKKIISLIIAILTAVSLVSCSAEPETGETSPADSDTPEITADNNSEEENVITADAEGIQDEELTEEGFVLNNVSDFKPVIRIAVCSDIHLSDYETKESDRFRLLFDTVYEYSDSHPSYNRLDALLVAGDFTNQGYESQYKLFNSIIAEKMRDETALVTVMGNHEYANGGPDEYVRCMNDTQDKHIVINGFHIIGISPDGDSNHYSDKQVKWLKSELQAAVDDDPEKPIFSFRHHHLQDTVYVSRSWYTSSTPVLRKRAYDSFPQIIDFSGDSHGPMNNPLSIWQDKFTMLNTGTLSYFEMERGMTGGTLPSGKENAAQYYIVEVDSDNHVLIQPYNILTRDFFRTASNTDSPDAQLYYVIEKPSDSSTFAYTPARGENCSAPFFADDAVPSVDKISYTGATITVPQAFDDSCIYSYRLVLTDEEGNTSEYKYFSEYYFEPMPETVSYKVSGLRDGMKYEFSVYPVNAWEKEGEPIKGEFTTEKYEEVDYVSVHPVTFAGTFTDFESFTELTKSSGNYAYSGEITGDVFGGEWDGPSAYGDVKFTLAEGKGYNGSTALGISMNASNHSNRAAYIFRTDENGLTEAYPRFGYIRVWADFTGIDFRKASFGLVTSDGSLYSTDDTDGKNNLKFYYMAEGSDKWETLTHGSDGCFGAAQDSSIADKKGWFAFPVSDMRARSGGGDVWDFSHVSGVYFYFDYSEDSMTGHEFYFDEISLVGDYTEFIKY